jgi:PhnB protein
MTMQTATLVSRRKFVAAAASVAVVSALPGHAAGLKKVTTTQGESMTKLTTYLLFDGTCGDAMKFYQSCLGGNLTLTRVKDSPAKDQMSAAQQEKVLNAHLSSGPMEFSASDWLAPDENPVRGNTICMFVNGGSTAELTKLFESLSEGAKVTNPLRPTFFGIYGALNDRFSVRWMFAGDFGPSK